MKLKSDEQYFKDKICDYLGISKKTNFNNNYEFLDKLSLIGYWIDKICKQIEFNDKEKKSIQDRGIFGFVILIDILVVVYYLIDGEEKGGFNENWPIKDVKEQIKSLSLSNMEKKKEAV